MLDVIYPVRPGDSNDELRFSLRSLRHLPHRRVWIVGHKPAWVTNVEWIPGNTAKWPRANLYRNLQLACTHPGLTDQVIIFNDDIYITEPVEQVPVLFRGTLADQLNTVIRLAGRKGWWQESLGATQKVLTMHGHPNALSYELHTPFPCDRHAMAVVLERFVGVQPRNPPQWRTLYGNIQRIGGRVFPDVKHLRPAPLGHPFHSTDDLSWKYFRAKFLQLFPDPSPYEIVQADARSLVNVAPRTHPRRTRA